MKRRVERELLDELPADDPRAVKSRRDLRRVNAWMTNGAVLAGALRLALANHAPGRLVDLGAGDGTLLLGVAQQLAGTFSHTSVALLDRQNNISDETLAGFQRLGWRAEVVESEVLDWLRGPEAQPGDAMVSNLFVHHFHRDQLTELLCAVAAKARVFVAVEPRRSAWTLASSRLLGLIGCNAVTRHDARISVRAGFAGRELSEQWPRDEAWQLRERGAGWFSHLFLAQRSAPLPGG